MKSWNDYLQPNGTLKNKLGIQSQEELSAVEYAVSRQQQQILRQNFYRFPNGYQLLGEDVTELKKVNFFLLADIYAWAGTYREVDFNKTTGGVVTHFHPVVLFGNAERDIQCKLTAFSQIDRRKLTVAHALGTIITEINIFHPFREGNGRSLRIFAEVMAFQKGYRLEFTPAQYRAYTTACIEDDAKLMARVCQFLLKRQE